MYIASWFGAIIMTIIFVFIFALLVPTDMNFDDPMLETIFTMLGLIAIMVVVLPSSIAVLKIKNRSMWWLLLFWWHSPLWLSDSKQQCKANYIYVVLVFDAIFLTDGLTYTIEYAQKNPLGAIFWYGIFIYGIAMILTVIANSDLGKDDIIALEDLPIHNAKEPEVKE